MGSEMCIRDSNRSTTFDLSFLFFIYVMILFAASDFPDARVTFPVGGGRRVEFDDRGHGRIIFERDDGVVVATRGLEAGVRYPRSGESHDRALVPADDSSPVAVESSPSREGAAVLDADDGGTATGIDAFGVFPPLLHLRLSTYDSTTANSS